MIRCEKCGQEHADGAVFCLQCGRNLEEAPGAGPGPEEPRCPECGGKVRAGEGGKGVCTDCGTELVARSDAPSAAEALSRLIKEKLRAGIPLELAVDAACAEFLRGPEQAPDEPLGFEACPVCGQDHARGSEQCEGCGIVLMANPQRRPCPRCGEEVSGETCGCGAILTLDKLVEFVDPAVQHVCPTCKQLFTVDLADCPSCGSKVLRAARLKEYAARRA